MKKKLVIILLIISVLHAISWYFDIIRFYNYPTSANEPNLKEGSRFAWSSWTQPKKLDFICFKATDDVIGEFESAMRLVALPHDTLEIKSGNLFVNNVRIDDHLNLRRLYKCDLKYFNNKIKPVYNKLDYFYGHKLKDSMLFFMDDNVIKINNLNLVRHILDKNEVDNIIESKFGKNWNKDHFGPIVIPDDAVFVLGDNRENSLDSRYLGLIDNDKILGTLLFKF